MLIDVVCKDKKTPFFWQKAGIKNPGYSPGFIWGER